MSASEGPGRYGPPDARPGPEKKDWRQEKRACGLCGREVALRFNVPTQRARVPHKCPHGRWCRAGQMPDGLHATTPSCPECREEADDQ